MVTRSLEEPALAPARTLARVCPTWSTCLRSCNVVASKLTSTLPVSRLSRRHMRTWPRTWPPSSWASLILRGWRSFQKLLLTTAALVIPLCDLLAQINYIVDVAANMPANAHTTASGVFRLAWRGKQTSTTIVVRLRTVNICLPQPVASCLRSPPDTTPFPTLVPVVFHPSAPTPVDFVCHARWKFEYPLSLPVPFVSRLRL